MKRLFFAMAAMAAMLTSCSKDETTTAPVIERSKVTFTVNAPELSTRAGEGKGLSATQLEYVIYDLAESPENGANQIYGTADFVNDGDNNPLTTTVEVDLVEGRTYDAIFFASAPEGAPYTINWIARTLTVDDALVANQEAYDAFYKYVPEFEITTAQYNVNVEMTRPFAQLNIGTNDFLTQAGKLIDAETVQVTVSNIYKTLDLDGNDPDTDVSNSKKVTYSFAPRMQGTIDAAGKEYDWLSMNYILVNAREMVGVTFEFTDKTNNGTQTYTRTYSDVPVERNYRTNIVGSILTSPTDFKVEILPDFEDTEMGQIDGVNYYEVGVATADELQAAIDAAPEGQITVIKVTADITGDVTVPQKENVKIIISGASDTRSENKRSFEGMITVDGKSKRYETAGLTIKGLNFNAESVNGDACIRLGNGDNNSRYTNNVTVEDCTFNVPGAVGVKSYTGGDWNLTIAGCTATDKAHSLAQLDNVEKNLLIKDCVANSKNGINLNHSEDVVIDNYTADVRGYAVRFGDSGGTTTTKNYSIKNSSLKTDNSEGDAVIVLRGSANYSILTIVDTTIEGNKKIDKDNAPNAKIYIDVSSDAALAAALAAGGEVALTADVEVSESLVIPEGVEVTLNLNGKKITGKNTQDDGPVVKNEGTLTIIGGTISSTAENGPSAVYNYGTLTLENATIVGAQNGTSGNASYAVNTTGAGSKLTVKNSSISGRGAVGATNGTKVEINGGTYHTPYAHWGHAVYAYGEGTEVVINGGTFTEGYDYANDLYGMYQIYASNKAKVIVNDGDFSQEWDCANGYDLATAGEGDDKGVIEIKGGVFADNPSNQYGKNYVAAGYVATKNTDNTYTVTSATLEDGAVLDLGGVEYNGTIVANGDLTILGNTKIKTLTSTTGCEITIEDGKTLTLNNFSFGSGSNPGQTYEIKGGTVVANYGFFQHGTYELHSDFETGYMYYSFGSNITVYGTFHSQGKGDGLDYVRGNLTIAAGGKSIHDKTLWVGQPASWGAMEASLTIEPGGYVQANSLSVYEGSSLTYYNDADLKYNNVTGTDYITKATKTE